MNLISSLRERLPRGVVPVLVLAVTALSVAVIWSAVDGQALAQAARTARGEPVRVLAAVAAFGVAFLLRAAAWRRVLPGLSFGHALSGIHLALGGNHLLPLRLGEPMRVVSVVRRAGASLDSAAASVVALRSADLLAVVGLGLVAGPAALAGLAGRGSWLVFAGLAAVALAAWLWLHRLAGQRRDVRLPGPAALGLSVVAWLCEAALVWQAARRSATPV